nr:hypothetical protein [Tanacetum cinerariifolium]
KIILHTYGDIVTLKRRRDDDADKDEEPSAGSNRGSKRRREGKEPESKSAPNEKATRTTGLYAVLILQYTSYCLEEQIHSLDCRDQYVVLSGRVDTSYLTGGYGVSVDLSEQDT